MPKSALFGLGVICIIGAAWVYFNQDKLKRKNCSCEEAEEKKYNVIDSSKLDEILLQ
ncbi:MAG: hypothetical protein MK066_14615 [Crocinitomicaceae bacterium]|nr:hypothetical protein [Crocinitomicaceae bacterium]